MRLSHDLRAELRLFAFYLANRTLCLEVLRGVDYSPIFSEPSALEQAIAVYANVLDLDETGKVRDAEAAHRRAAQYIRSFLDPTYEVHPPFEDWELELPI
jgi:hypothetical protein